MEEKALSCCNDLNISGEVPVIMFRREEISQVVRGILWGGDSVSILRITQNLKILPV